MSSALQTRIKRFSHFMPSLTQNWPAPVTLSLILSWINIFPPYKQDTEALNSRISVSHEALRDLFGVLWSSAYLTDVKLITASAGAVNVKAWRVIGDSKPPAHINLWASSESTLDRASDGIHYHYPDRDISLCSQSVQYRVNYLTH